MQLSIVVALDLTDFDEKANDSISSQWLLKG